MKELGRYGLNEWLALTPIVHRMRGVRNRVLMFFYLRKGASAATEFAEKIRGSRKCAVVAIAFEQVEVIDWLIASFAQNVEDGFLLIADNSRDVGKAREIEKVCWHHRVPYLRLPKNKTRHVNRSHSMAMEWVYQRVIKVASPDFFGFIDHDLIPVVKVSLLSKLKDQDFYGLSRPGGKNDADPYAWSLWAGYCFFNNKKLNDFGFNFLYDFSRGLDTGGGNYERIYRNYIKKEIRFSPVYGLILSLPNLGEVREVQQIDEEWYHIGSVSYNNNIKNKIDVINGVRAALIGGYAWGELISDKHRSW
jgi:hypothetical protein